MLILLVFWQFFNVAYLQQYTKKQGKSVKSIGLE